MFRSCLRGDAPIGLDSADMQQLMELRHGGEAAAVVDAANKAAAQVHAALLADIATLASCLGGDSPIGLDPADMQQLMELRHGGEAAKAAAAAAKAAVDAANKAAAEALAASLGGDAPIGMLPEEMQQVIELRRKSCQSFEPPVEESRSFSDLRDIWAAHSGERSLSNGRRGAARTAGNEEAGAASGEEAEAASPAPDSPSVAASAGDPRPPSPESQIAWLARQVEQHEKCDDTPESCQEAGVRFNRGPRMTPTASLRLLRWRWRNRRGGPRRWRVVKVQFLHRRRKPLDPFEHDPLDV